MFTKDHTKIRSMVEDEEYSAFMTVSFVKKNQEGKNEFTSCNLSDIHDCQIAPILNLRTGKLTFHDLLKDRT